MLIFSRSWYSRQEASILWERRPLLLFRGLLCLASWINSRSLLWRQGGPQSRSLRRSCSSLPKWRSRGLGGLCSGRHLWCLFGWVCIFCAFPVGFQAGGGLRRAYLVSCGLRSWCLSLFVDRQWQLCQRLSCLWACVGHRTRTLYSSASSAPGSLDIAFAQPCLLQKLETTWSAQAWSLCTKT